MVSKIKSKILFTLHRNSDIFDLDSDSKFADTIKKARDYPFDESKIIQDVKDGFEATKIVKKYEKVFLSPN